MPSQSVQFNVLRNSMSNHVSDLIIVKVLINRVLFKPVLINIGCKYYFIMNKDLITKLRFPRLKIPPKSITGFIKENIKEP